MATVTHTHTHSRRYSQGPIGRKPQHAFIINMFLERRVGMKDKITGQFEQEQELIESSPLGP